MPRGEFEKKIGNYFVMIGAIHRDDAQKIYEQQLKGDNRFFGDIAIELDLIDDNALIAFLKKHSTTTSREEEEAYLVGA